MRRCVLFGDIAMCFERACEIINELRADNAISDDVATHAMEILSWNTDAEKSVKTLERFMFFLQHHAEDENKIWENIVMEIPYEVLSDEVITHLYRNHIADIELAHLPLSDKWLRKYSKYDDEAAINLGKRMYSDGRYSALTFFEFLSEYRNNGRVLEILLRSSMVDFAKANALMMICDASNDEYIKGLSENVRKYVQISFTTDIELIEKMYSEQQNPNVLLAISQNANTPEPILSELMKIRKMKDASVIRANATNTLKIKKILQKEMDW